MEGRKRTRGRRKIEIKRIEDDEARSIAFSTRKGSIAFSTRKGSIFKKAMELHTLCGAETAVIIFSPAGNCFSFGHPSVEDVTNRFLGVNPDPSFPALQALREKKLHKLNKQYVRLAKKIEAEEKKLKKYKEDLKNAAGNQGWWNKPIETLGLDELERFQVALCDVRNKVGNQMIENGCAFPLFESQMNPVDGFGDGPPPEP